MKLALIRRQFSATGGAELYLDRLIESLLGAGHEVHLFAECWPGRGSGLMFHEVPAEGSRADGPRRFAENVERLVTASPFDVVFSLERTLRQDVYRAGDGVHATWLEQRRRFASWWKRPWVGWGGFHRTMLELERRTFESSRTSRIIVNSRMVGDDIVSRFGFPRARVHLIRNGVKLNSIRQGRREETRRSLGIGEKDRALLFAGSGWERKGLKFLLKAFESWNRKDAWLVVAGKGKPPKPKPPRVIFTGPLESIADVCAASDLFTFLPIYEPSSNVVFEALAAGLPVVTTRANGASEILTPGVHGEVIEDPSDVDLVIQALSRWTDRPRLDSRLVDSLELGIDRNVRQTMEVLELAAQERGDRA